MPIHLPPLSRRRFLTGLGSSLFAPALASAASGTDEALIAILNDTHIGEKQPLDSPIPSHLRATVQFLLSLPSRPAAVVINGDLALKDGQPGDYKKFIELIKPLREAGMAVHLTLGNHDDRRVFLEAHRDSGPASPLAASRQVGIVETAHANLFLLDSLKQTMIAQGDLGREQLDWLAAKLDATKSKPTLVIAHHNPRLGGDPKHFPGGLEDSAALWRLLAPRRHVKAYIHGHIHHWSLAAHEDIHIINTPATSYVANLAESTTGWTMARLSDTGVELTLRTHIVDHPWNGENRSLRWRS